MARPTKQGIDYFSLDVNFLKDIKVRKIRKACGPQSIEILLCLLGNIYRENGYYIGWDEDTVFLVADEVGAKEGLVEEVVAKAIQSKFFDHQKYEQYKILTSNGIQKRYFEATTKRKGVEVKKEFLVNDDSNPSSTVVNDGNNYSSSGINEGDNEQSKVNKTKVNKSKTNNYVFGVFEFLETNQFGNPYSEPMATDISEWIKNLRGKGLKDSQIDDWMIMGVKVASGNNRRFWNYVDGVLRNWDNVAAYTKEDIEIQKKNKSGGKKGKKLENTGSSEYDNLGW
ncbi:DUF4373 domain-containing protein [Enterococcus devriesei]|uniref:Lin1244/Lin1753 domain-containing protein n=1 Tax=Enterococcus devriesei TaxID=319970 RepID=UPI001C126A48|nr:Lin1244/Lin1753 domain-containing protein [Enterococcus devriesei]MBU5364266.1 DUF4373 domain-containing protein [Enterococcus devriesei]